MRLLQEMCARPCSLLISLSAELLGDNPTAQVRLSKEQLMPPQSQLTVMSKNKWFPELLLVQAMLWKPLDGWRLFGNGRCQLSRALHMR